jgi:hypothetical protein
MMTLNVIATIGIALSALAMAPVPAHSEQHQRLVGSLFNQTLHISFTAKNAQRWLRQALSQGCNRQSNRLR